MSYVLIILSNINTNIRQMVSYGQQLLIYIKTRFVKRTMFLATSITTYVYDKLFVYQFISTLLAYLTIKLCFYLRARKRRFELFAYYGIPGPKANLLTGHMSLSRQNAAYFKFDEYCRSKFGKTFGLHLGDEPVLMTTDLELLRGIFLDKIDSFKRRMYILIRGPFDDSIFLVPYHRWTVARRLMSPYFTRYTLRGSDSAQFIEDNVKLLLEYIENKLDCKNDSSSTNKQASIELDILDLMKSLALRMISDMAICLPDAEVEENHHNVKSLDKVMSTQSIEWVRKYPFLKGIVEFLSGNFEFSLALKIINRCLNASIDAKIKQFKEHPTIKDDENSSKLIDRFIRMHYEGKLTREEVISNCYAVLVAGYDTTSSTLTYIFWVLAKHQHVQEKLRAELVTYGTESKYLEQVINETMRLYPIIILFTSRLATETVTINNVTIPQGTRAIFNTWLVHRDPTIWPDPLKFDPERFKPGAEHHLCAFAPFGIGSRKCLGEHLALLEMKIVLTDVLMKYKIDLVSPVELDLVSGSEVFTRPKENVVIKLTRL